MLPRLEKDKTRHFAANSRKNDSTVFEWKILGDSGRSASDKQVSPQHTASQQGNKLIRSLRESAQFSSTRSCTYFYTLQPWVVMVMSFPTRTQYDQSNRLLSNRNEQLKPRSPQNPLWAIRVSNAPRARCLTLVRHASTKQNETF